jgi:hypothetical protein
MPTAAAEREDRLKFSVRAMSRCASHQNLALAGLSKPHFGHRHLNDSPHSTQNFAPGAFSALHFEQVTSVCLRVR